MPRLRLVLLPRRILDQNGIEKHGDDADRHVDEKDPAPGRIVGDEAAERRPEHRRDDGGDRGDAEGGAALFRREGIEDDRLLVGLQAAAEEALQQPEDDELGRLSAMPHRNEHTVNMARQIRK